MIDDLVEIDSARGPVNVPQTPYKKRAWAINVNVQEKIENFYEKIPNMAHTVRNVTIYSIIFHMFLI